MSILKIVDKQDDVQTSIRMSKELLKRAKKYAIDHDTSLAALVIEALESYLGRKEK
jgi:predicted DNA-binding protein